MTKTDPVKCVTRLAAIPPVVASLRDFNSTLTILDWDDTLVCTSFLKADLYPLANQQTIEQCRLVCSAAVDLLNVCLKHGRVIIVTNSATSWVKYAVNTFFPSLKTPLKSTAVISARDLYSDAYPTDPAAWKRSAFRLLYMNESNLITVGDSVIDHDLSIPVGLRKTVKFKKMPSPQDLVRQMDLLKEKFSEIATSSRNLRITMTPRNC